MATSLCGFSGANFAKMALCQQLRFVTPLCEAVGVVFHDGVYYGTAHFMPSFQNVKEFTQINTFHIQVVVFHHLPKIKYQRSVLLAFVPIRFFCC